MKDFDIKVPRFEWLIGGSRIGGSYNTYYGSIGTDAQKGFLCSKIFNYKVAIEKTDEHEVIKAAFYGGHKSFDNMPESEITEENFECEEESIASVKAWLEGKCREFYGE